MGWNLWHLARWDDYLAEVLLVHAPALSHLGPATQIWKSRAIAKRWGLDSVELGLEEAGTSLADHAAATLNLPPKRDVTGYATEAFDHLDAVLPNLDDSLLQQVLPTVGPDGLPADDNYGDTVVAFMNHAYEHFGTMQALQGMLRLPSTVTG